MAKIVKEEGLPLEGTILEGYEHIWRSAKRRRVVVNIANRLNPLEYSLGERALEELRYAWAHLSDEEIGRIL